MGFVLDLSVVCHWLRNAFLIFTNGVGRSRGSGKFTLRKGVDLSRSEGEEGGIRGEVWRYGSITEVRASTGLENRAETRGFVGADWELLLHVSVPNMVSTRATHNRGYRGRRVAVKCNFDSVTLPIP